MRHELRKQRGIPGHVQPESPRQRQETEVAPSGAGPWLAVRAGRGCFRSRHRLLPRLAGRPESAASAADGQQVLTGSNLTGTTASGAPDVGGWGEGGYPMVAGSAAGAPGNSGEAAAARASGATAVTNVASENWAGHAATGAALAPPPASPRRGPQPAVACGATATFSSFGAGLYGDGTPTVEQTGTEADWRPSCRLLPGVVRDFPERAGVLAGNPRNWVMPCRRPWCQAAAATFSHADPQRRPPRAGARPPGRPSRRP